MNDGSATASCTFTTASMAEAVEAFLAGMNHARMPEIEALRRAIRAARGELTERVKWNAPSFCSGVAGA